MAPKIVTVYGATGAQGGSVARSLLANTSKAFAVRAITRNPSSDVAKSLAEAGAEVVQADGLKKDEMVEAMKGSWAVFVNTNSDCPVSCGHIHGLDKMECQTKRPSSASLTLL
jgi:saccharopine dehydrogenase-like NADP-dependent oxidoreductase